MKTSLAGNQSGDDQVERSKFKQDGGAGRLGQHAGGRLERGRRGTHVRVKPPALTLLCQGTMEPTSRYWEEEEKEENVKLRSDWTGSPAGTSARS